jgi:hypothetical protein
MTKKAIVIAMIVMATVLATVAAFAADKEETPSSGDGLLEVTALGAEDFRPASGTVFTVKSETGFYVRLPNCFTRKRK